MTDEAPRPPAHAYMEMSSLVGDTFFLLPPPQRGKVLQVAGIDGIVTEWKVTDLHGTELADMVRDHPRLRLVAMRREPVEDRL